MAFITQVSFSQLNGGGGVQYVPQENFSFRIINCSTLDEIIIVIPLIIIMIIRLMMIMKIEAVKT